LSWNARWEGGTVAGTASIPVAYSFGAGGPDVWKAPFDGALWYVLAAQDNTPVAVTMDDVFINGVSLSGAGAFTPIVLGAGAVDFQPIGGYPILTSQDITVSLTAAGKAFVTITMIFQNI
jgi:hypothetical protein